MKKIQTPLTKEKISNLKAGESVLLTGTIYTARDQAHKRLVEFLEAGKELPIKLDESVIYYCGPTATPEGKVIGACGPTTSKRMDPFVEPLMKAGHLAMIGKGRRGENVRQAVVEHQGVYFASPSGCGALLAKCVKEHDIIAFEDLGPEAIRKLEVEDFPLIVAIDCEGNDIYERLK